MAVADNVPNRVELMSLLLSAGANPNLVIDSDEGPPLRPVLAEYVGSNDQPSPLIVKLLLRFGAKVQSHTLLKPNLHKAIANFQDKSKAVLSATVWFSLHMVGHLYDYRVFS